MNKPCMTPVERMEARRIMERCARGAGYLPTRAELRILQTLLRRCADEYQALHREVRGEADAEVRAGWKEST